MFEQSRLFFGAEVLHIPGAAPIKVRKQRLVCPPIIGASRVVDQGQPLVRVQLRVAQQRLQQALYGIGAIAGNNENRRRRLRAFFPGQQAALNAAAVEKKAPLIKLSQGAFYQRLLPLQLATLGAQSPAVRVDGIELRTGHQRVHHRWREKLLLSVQAIDNQGLLRIDGNDFAVGKGDKPASLLARIRIADRRTVAVRDCDIVSHQALACVGLGARGSACSGRNQTA